MRIGIFGGSFDPVHHGHLLLADCCWKQARLDRVDFLPAARQPLKPQGPVADDADRLAMLRLAVAGRPEFAVSSLEIDRGGISYTVDTMRLLARQFQEAELYLLMGADSLAEFPTWREPEVICSLATPVVVQRAGSPPPDFDSLASLVSPERLEAIRNLQVSMPATPISSSRIRQLIAGGAAWETQVPRPVAEYIESRRLYRS